jgi:hypothetical protein
MAMRSFKEKLQVEEKQNPIGEEISENISILFHPMKNVQKVLIKDVKMEFLMKFPYQLIKVNLTLWTTYRKMFYNL